MMVDISSALNAKYNILAQQAHAAQTEADARARLLQAQTDATPGEAAARNAAAYGAAAASRGAGLLSTTNAGLAPTTAAAENTLRAAQARGVNTTADLAPGLANSEIGLRSAQGNAANASANYNNTNASLRPSEVAAANNLQGAQAAVAQDQLLSPEGRRNLMFEAVRRSGMTNDAYYNATHPASNVMGTIGNVASKVGSALMGNTGSTTLPPVTGSDPLDPNKPAVPLVPGSAAGISYVTDPRMVAVGNSMPAAPAAGASAQGGAIPNTPAGQEQIMPLHTFRAPGFAAGTSSIGGYIPGIDPGYQASQGQITDAASGQPMGTPGFQYVAGTQQITDRNVPGNAAGNSGVKGNKRGLVNAKGGKDSVPGKGDGTKDTTLSALAPGEAVLNRAAADHLGRPVIDLLNAAGAQKMGLEQQPNQPAAVPVSQLQNVPGSAAGNNGKAPPQKAAPGKPAGKAPATGAPGKKNAPSAKSGGPAKGGSSSISPAMIAALANIMHQGPGPMPGPAMPMPGAPGPGGPGQLPMLPPRPPMPGAAG